jgi:hypothetical protein
VSSCCAIAGQLNPRLQDLPPNQWVKFSVSSERGWHQQGHAGVVYDSKRGTVLLYGSNTHGKDWDNSVREFDPLREKWIQHYPSANPDTYRLDINRNIVSGPAENPQPWAMHTYDALVYDPVNDQLVVASTPAHQQRKIRQFKGQKPKVSITWLYDLETHTWSMLDNGGKPPPSTFAGAIAYDEKRDTIFLYSKRKFAELGPDRNHWITGSAPRIGSIHFMLEYDVKNHVILSFGDYKGSDKIWAYAPGDVPGVAGKWLLQEPEGDTIPADEHYPVAYDASQGVFLLVPDGPESAETYIYNYSAGTIRHLSSAHLPGKLRMNYKMIYDPRHRVFLLITGNWDKPTTVWALKLDLSQ